MHHYRSNGLAVASELALPELHPSTGPADVTIRYGAVPERLEAPVSRGARFEAAPGQYVLQVDGVARYGVWGGREIRIDPAPGVPEQDLRAFLLSAVMGAVFHQRGVLPLHASAVANDTHCLLFCGKSGAGKSTLAAALCGRGFHLVSDNICSVWQDPQGMPVIYRESRRLKLWADALERLPALPGTPSRLREGMEKFSVPLASHQPDAPQRVTHVFCLDGSLEGDRLTLLQGAEKLRAVRLNTFRRKVVTDLETQASHFAHLDALCRHARVYRLGRPAPASGLHERADLIEHLLRA